MAITAAKLLVEVDANVANAKSGLETVEDKLRKLAGTGNSVGQIFAGVFGANLAAGAITGLKNLAAEGLNAYASYERLGMSLQTLTARELVNTGAAKNMAAAYAAAEPKAKELLAWTQKLAIESPFTQDDVAQAFRLAEAYGFTAEEAQRLTQAVIDFAAGSGASGEVMGQISLALGQIQAKGKLAGQEVLQLVNAGISVDQILADAFGKSTAEINQMREQGLIPADAAIQAIVKSLEEDFGGAAKRQAGTFSGLISSLKDIKSVGLREFFTGTFETIQPVIQDFVNSFTSGDLQAKIRDVGKAFGEWTGDVIVKLQELNTWWSNFDGTTQKNLIALGALVAFRKPIAGLFAEMAGGLKVAAGVASAIGGVATAAIGAFAAGVVLLGNSADKMRADEETAVGAATKVWNDFGMSVQKNGKTVTQVLDEYAAAQKRVAEVQPTDSFTMGAEVNDMTDNLKSLSAGLITASGDYDEYRTAMQGAIDTGKFLVDVNGDIYRDLGGATVPVDGLKLLSEAEYEAAKAAEELQEKLNNYVDGPLRGMVSAQNNAKDATDDNTEAQKRQKEQAEETAKAQEKYTSAMKAFVEAQLQAGLSGNLTNAMNDYKQTLADLAPEQETLLARLKFLDQEGWIPSAESVAELAAKLREQNSAMSEGEAIKQAEIQLLASHQSQLNEVKGALDENAAAQQAAAEAMRQATAEMIYQQAAAGLDASASLELARGMGMISEADFAVASTIQNLRLQYDAMDGAIDGVIANQAGFVQSSLGVNAAVQSLIDKNLPLTFENIAASLSGAFANVDLATALSNVADDPEMQHAIRKEFETAAEGAQEPLDALATDAQTAATNAIAAFTGSDFVGTGTQAGTDIVTGFKAGVAGGEKGAGGLIAVSTTTITALKTLWTTTANWAGVGTRVIEGIASKLSDPDGLLGDAIRAAIQAALDAAQDAAGIQSPSKLFAAKVGEPISQGMALGILQAAPLPAAAVQSVIHQSSSYDYRQVTIAPTVSTGADMQMFLEEVMAAVRSEFK